MTNAQPSTPRRVLLPGAAILLFIAAPILLPLGALLVSANESGTEHLEVTLTLMGTVAFWIGVAALIGAVILEGVRSIAQQQLEILRAEREHDKS